MLDAAARLFGSQLYHEVRMDDIAAEASVGKGTLYRYFTDKEDLFEALLLKAAEQLQKRIRHAIDSTEGYRNKLIAVVDAGIAFYDERPHLGPLVQRAEVIRGKDSPWQSTRHQFSQWIKEVLIDAERAGEFRVRQPDIDVYFLVGGVRHIVLFTPKPRPAGLAEHIVDTFLRGAAIPLD
jgi:AcrR family transcriptional regulator